MKSSVFVVGVMFAATAAQAAVGKDSLKVIHYAVPVNVKALDPLTSVDLYSATVMGQIFESLYEFHYLKRPFTLEPSLAEAMPEVSKDRLTYKVRLKKGVFFQDDPAFPGGKGREMVAGDVVYSIQRLADPRNHSEAYFSIDGRLKGLTAWSEGLVSGKTSYDTVVEGVRALDAHTVEFKLLKPYPQFTQVLAMVSMSVVPRDVAEHYGPEFINHPVGTGPFRLQSAADWVRGSQVKLIRNANYRRATYPTEGAPGDRERGLLASAGKTLPFADQVVFHEMTEAQPRWLSGMAGKLDFFEIPSDNYGSAVDDQKRLKPELAEKGLQLSQVNALEVSYISFNMKDPVAGKNKKLRQAMSLAYDSQAYIDTFWPNRAIAAQSMVPPGIDTYDPAFKNPYRQFNLAKAKQLLREAGYPEGQGLSEIVLDATADSKSRQIAEFFQRQMAQIGVHVRYNPVTWPELLKRIKEGRHQMVALSWGAVYPDPQAFYMSLASENLPPGPNEAGFSDPRYDELYNQATRMEPGKKRTSLYRQMRDIVVDEAPWIFNIHPQRFYLNQPTLKNYKPMEVSVRTFKYLDLTR